MKWFFPKKKFFSTLFRLKQEKSNFVKEINKSPRGKEWKK